MPKKDLEHNAVVNAVTADDWKITDDPLHLSCGGRTGFLKQLFKETAHTFHLAEIIILLAWQHAAG